MVTRAAALIVFAVIFLPPVPAGAQATIAAELDMTGGYSGEEVRAAASQLRLFGEAPGRIGFFAEAAWGDRWAGDSPIAGEMVSGVDPMGSDVFGAAYPYRGRTQLIELYAERYFRPRGAMIGVRG